MNKVLIATEKPFAPAAVEQIKLVLDEAGYQLEILEKYTGADEFKNAIKNVDALIVRSDKVTSDIIDATENLKVVVRAGAGYDNLDLEACSKKSIVAMNTPGQNSNAVAELAFGMMIYHARNAFDGTSGKELRDKKIGIHAFGNVGRFVAEIAKGFGMDVYAYDPFVEKQEIEKHGVKVFESAEELYKNCQYISLNIPANDKTKKSIDYKIMSSMPKNATIVNTARKEVVCEESLLKVLEERPDFSYLSDIAPDCRETIENKYEGRYVFTAKKMGAQTSEANIKAGIAAAKQIVNYIEKGDTTFKVN